MKNLHFLVCHIAVTMSYLISHDLLGLGDSLTKTMSLFGHHLYLMLSTINVFLDKTVRFWSMSAIQSMYCNSIVFSLLHRVDVNEDH